QADQRKRGPQRPLVIPRDARASHQEQSKNPNNHRREPKRASGQKHAENPAVKDGPRVLRTRSGSAPRRCGKTQMRPTRRGCCGWGPPAVQSGSPYYGQIRFAFCPILSNYPPTLGCACAPWLNPMKPHSPPGEDRRGFFKQAAAICLGAVSTLVPLVAGLLTWLDPLRRKAGPAGFVHVTSLSALPEDGS